MRKKGKKKYEELKGRELIDAILKNSVEIVTPEEMLKMERFERLRSAKLERKREIISAIIGVIKKIIYPPLAIAFHAVHFISKIIGQISAVGIIVGVWYAYKSFLTWRTGIPFGEIKEVKSAIAFMIFPFIAYGISVAAEYIWIYFEDNV